MINLFSKLSKFFLYLVPFTVLIVSRSTLFPFIVGKYVFFRVVVELALIFFLWAWVRGEFQFSKLKLKILTPLVIAVSVFTLIFLLAGFLGYDPSASFWSNFERGEGGLQMLHLFIFFVLLGLLFRDEKAWRRMFIVSALVAVLVIAYGFAAALKISGFIGPGICERFAGSLGNSAYIGTFMIFALFYAGYLLINGLRQSASGPHKFASLKKWLWGSLMVLFLIILIFSGTRGAFLGLAAGVLAGLSYLFFRLPSGRVRKIILFVIIVLIIFGWLGFKYRSSIDLMPFCKNEGQGGNRILDINLSTENLQTRFFLWKQSIKIFEERPILGWGPENFSPAIEKYHLPQFTVWFDRAHNIFFDYLTTTGILGLLSYLSIFIVFYWQFLKKMRKSALSPYQSALIFALPIAYLVQGVVLFEVLPIYINLFLFLAFANYKFNNKF
ncbi:MAG: O-antigen ligase family protein [bacterium]|nr:O-antigen ligase family protein [bacterium]